MNRPIIGLLFILCGVVYGSMAIDDVYGHTLGWLVKNDWVKAPPADQSKKSVSPLGRKPTILLYSFILIIIGIFILWNRNS